VFNLQMNVETGVNPTTRAPAFTAYLALIKFRLLALVLVSTCMGYFISANADSSLLALLFTLVGTTLVGGGANTLNQCKERHADAQMFRTRMRPLPSGRVKPLQALLFGFAISWLGFIIIALGVNRLTLLLSFLSWASYLLVYTPLKTRSVLNTWIGAVPGSLPAVLGCTAASGMLGNEAWALFLILFVWQMPHFFAISWVYREDYLRGGFRMLSWNDETGRRTALHILVHTILLIPTSTGLYLTGDFGLVYLVLTLLNGLVFLWYAIAFSRNTDKAGARKVFQYSVMYLPLVFVAIFLDRLFL
jgi:protoheme IX farnesyltransferase